ncbi:hypothetical protein R3P38DRAFT_3184554 [Favolaschia claudopus]|uniref:DUF6589 domain-containing protein n=1 Tax=Favolaschia claudopus TaxID=2862362 RepID=A0AAW0C838_9AGAR
MHTVVPLISALLHASLFFFFGGLIAFLIPVNRYVMLLSIVLLAILVVVYGILTIIPLTFYDFPYRTPLSSGLWLLFQLFRAICENSVGTACFWKNSMVDNMNHSARDQRALCWTVKSLADDIELEPFLEGILDILWSSNGHRKRYDAHIRVLLHDPEIQHCRLFFILATLKYDDTYWKSLFPAGHLSGLSLEDRLQLIFSLMIFLSVSTRQLVYWLFTTEIPCVTKRISHFMGFFGTESSLESQFAPALIFGLWLDGKRWPKAQKYIREMCIPCAHELALEDSNRVITSPLLQIRLKTLTIKELRDILHPTKLSEIVRGLAPFTWGLLHTFVASPNRARKQRAAADDTPMPLEEEEEWGDDPNDDSDVETGDANPENITQTAWSKDYPGFSRNPVFVILLVVCMLGFVRNRSTNLLPLILGLFFKISGTSARVIQMLSNAGICVSGQTVERLKVRITENAISLAIQLILSGQVFFTIFDNINIFLRKSQQRLSNTNDMINATNSAVVGIPDVEAFTEADLAEQLALRGRRAAAKPADILPTPEDDEIVGKSFTALIAEIIVSFTPGNSGWKDRKNIADEVGKMLPKDRPIPPTKSDARPFGVFDERSTVPQSRWSSIWRIFAGDWLTSSNLRAARRDRTDDVDAMQRLEYAQELSAPFHFALQATHMIMRTHYGHAVEDPASLSAHKGLLNRKWDVNKPNYAAAKSLIRHSLIARILHCVMVMQGFTLYSQLSKWQPTLDRIQEIALAISTQFATSTAAKMAQEAGDDWMAHSIYFIRDALFFCLFEKAVSFGDPGQLIRVLKYWTLAFRGVGQHNYARECAEVLIRWKYELPEKLRMALERSWFINRWGIIGRTIASDDESI